MIATLPLSKEFISAHSSKIKPLIDRFNSSGSLHSTLLFTGLEGVGKKSLVTHFLHLLFCDLSVFARAKQNDEEETGGLFGDAPTMFAGPELNGLEPCGKCKSCLRASQNQWLDYFWFEPEMNDEGTRLGVHKIEAFRDLKSKLGLGPSEEPFRVVVIAEADRMTPQAANSILKMLEEPPKNWIFILTASDSSRLLPTILSRCNEIKLNPLDSEQIFSILKTSKGLDFSSIRGKVASRAALGSLTRAMSYLDDEVWNLREQILGFLSNPSHEWMRLIDALSAGQKDLHLALDLFESILTDILKWRILGNEYSFIHEDQKEMLTQLADAKKMGAPQIISVIEQLAEKRRFVSLTLNAKLLAQEVLNPVLKII